MRYFLLATTAMLLASCTPATTQDTAEHDEQAKLASITITLDTETTEDEQATQHTMATLTVSGAANEKIDLGDILGTLQVAPPASYGVLPQPGAEVIGVLTSWWAGQGDEFIITRFSDPHAITIEHRTGDEEGTCSPPIFLATYPIAATTKITLQGFDPTVDQSSLQFCREEGAQNSATE